MRLHYPLKGIGTIPGIYLTQKFGNVWIAEQDMVVGGIKIKQGENVYKKIANINGHNGQDYGAPKGTPVLAAHDGRLITKPNDPDGYGIYVRVKWEEDGCTYDTVYGHLDRIEGEDRNVKAGEIIGYVDSTGFSTWHHLHFGIRKLLNGQVQDYNNGYLGYFDPQPFFMSSQTKVVKSKTSPTVYICYPVPSEQHLKERASLEGFEIPNPIPDTDSLK